MDNMYISSMVRKFRRFSSDERGSLAASLALVVITSMVALVLGAFSLSSSNAAKTAEAQTNMNAALIDVADQMDQSVKSTNTLPYTTASSATFANTKVVVTFNSITALPASSVPQGWTVAMTASWNNGERTSKKTVLVSQANTAFTKTGTITSFDTTGNAVWQ